MGMCDLIQDDECVFGVYYATSLIKPYWCSGVKKGVKALVDA